METKSPSNPTMKEVLNADTIKAIESLKERLKLSDEYIALLKDFRSDIEKIFVAGDEDAKRRHPEIAKFGSFEEFRRWYCDRALSKLEAEYSRHSRHPGLIALQQIVQELGRDAPDKFIVPLVETEKQDRSHNQALGGLHVEVCYPLPNGERLLGRDKWVVRPDEFEQEVRTSRVLHALKKEVVVPEFVDEGRKVISTPLYRRDLRYLLEPKDEKTLKYDEGARAAAARKMLDIVLDADIHLTMFHDRPEIRGSAPQEILDDLEKLVTSPTLDDNREQRLGMNERIWRENILSALKAIKKARENSRESIKIENAGQLDRDYFRLIVEPLLREQRIICHGDAFPGNAFEGFDGRIAVTDWTPVLAPVTHDLFRIIENFRLSPETKEQLFSYATNRIWDAAKEYGLELYGVDSRGELKKVASPGELHDRLLSRYPYMLVHQAIQSASILHRKRELRPAGISDEKWKEERAKIMEPDPFYSVALEIMEKLGSRDPAYAALKDTIEGIVETHFRGLLRRVPVDQKSFDYNFESMTGSVSMSLIGDFFSTGAPEAEGNDLEPDSMDLSPADLARLIRQRGTGAGHVVDVVPPGQMCDLTPESVAKEFILAMAEGKKIVDVGSRYHIEGNEIPLDYIGTKPPQIVEKVQGDWEFSLRGNVLHAINSSRNMHLTTNVRYQAEQYKKQDTDQMAQPEFMNIKVERGPFTDPRSVLQILHEREDQYGSGKVAIESLENCALFKANGKVVDELVWDTAPMELQLLKYYNQGLKRGYGLLFQFPVNGKTAPPAVEPISPLEHIVIKDHSTPTIFDGLGVLLKKWTTLFNVKTIPSLDVDYVRVDHSKEAPEIRAIVPTTVLVQNGRVYVTRDTSTVDAQELEKFSPDAAASMSRERKNSVVQKIARTVSPTAYEWFIDRAKESNYSRKVDEFPIMLNTREGLRCYTVVDGQSKVVSPVTLRRAKRLGLTPDSKISYVTDAAAYLFALPGLFFATSAGYSIANGDLKGVLWGTVGAALPLATMAAMRWVEKMQKEDYKKIMEEPPHYA